MKYHSLRTFVFFMEDNEEPLEELGLDDAEAAEKEAERMAADLECSITVYEELFTVNAPEESEK